MSEAPRYNCEICGSNMHPMIEHVDIGASGIEVVDVSKLILEGRYGKVSGGGWPNKPPVAHKAWVTNVDYAKNLIDEDVDAYNRKETDLDAMNGQTVVDLGAGMGYGYVLAAAHKAKSYIAVEPTQYRSTREFLTESTSDKKTWAGGIREGNELKYTKAGVQLTKPKAAIVVADMEQFLNNLPDKSVSIIVSGIDLAVINEEKARRINKEIIRVLHPKGLVLSYQSAVGFNEETEKASELEMKSALSGTAQITTKK